MKRFLMTIASVLVLAGLIACGAWSYVHRSAAPANEFQMTLVKLGDGVSKINSTGTLEPEEVIDVGAQAAGQILSYGKRAVRSCQKNERAHGLQCGPALVPETRPDCPRVP